jgi:hypothetical protein
VYTHTDIICWKKEREEEDNETLAQLKAFFLPFFFSFIFRETRGSVTPPLNRVEEEEGPGLKWTPKFCAHQRGASLIINKQEKEKEKEEGKLKSGNIFLKKRRKHNSCYSGR